MTAAGVNRPQNSSPPVRPSHQRCSACSELPQRSFSELGPVERALDDDVLAAAQAHGLERVDDLRGFGVHQRRQFARHQGPAVRQRHLEDGSVDAGLEGIGAGHPGGGDRAELAEDDVVLVGEVGVDDRVDGATAPGIVAVQAEGGGGVFRQRNVRVIRVMSRPAFVWTTQSRRRVARPSALFSDRCTGLPVDDPVRRISRPIRMNRKAFRFVRT